jgi:hypothetical protein
MIDYYYLFGTYLDSIDDYIIADLLQMVIFYWLFYLLLIILVGGFKHFIFSISYIWDVILPIDELHHYSEG